MDERRKSVWKTIRLMPSFSMGTLKFNRRLARYLVHSAYSGQRIPDGAALKWCELIKRVWEVDLLTCPRYGPEPRSIALIDNTKVAERILPHQDLWPEEYVPSKIPPIPAIQDCVIEPVLCATGGSGVSGSISRQTLSNNLKSEACLDN